MARTRKCLELIWDGNISVGLTGPLVVGAVVTGGLVGEQGRLARLTLERQEAQELADLLSSWVTATAPTRGVG